MSVLSALVGAVTRRWNRCTNSPTGHHEWDRTPTAASGWSVIRCQHCDEWDIA